MDRVNWEPIYVQAGTNYCIDRVLSRGATFIGRVLDDATGKPIPDARLIMVSDWSCYVGLDEEGRYKLSRINGPFEIQTQTSNHVSQVIKLGEAAEGSTVTVPDIRLKRGGWISGRVECPAELDSNAVAWIKLEFHGDLPTNSPAVIETVASAHTGGTFRT